MVLDTIDLIDKKEAASYLRKLTQFVDKNETAPEIDTIIKKKHLIKNQRLKSLRRQVG